MMGWAGSLMTKEQLFQIASLEDLEALQRQRLQACQLCLRPGQARQARLGY